MSRILRAFTLLAVFATSVAAEANVVIKDCDGNTQLIESSENNVVNIKAEISKDNIQKDSNAVITSAALSKTIKQDLKEEIVFEGISAGEWQLCAEPQRVSFKNVSVLKNGILGASNSALTLGAVGASAGAVAIALGDSDSSSNQASPSKISSSNANQIVSSDTAISKVPARKPNSQADEDESCFIGDKEDVTPISVF